MSKEHSTLKSFGYAFDGLKEALKNEPNIRIHFVLGIIASLLAFFLHFSLIEWSVLVLTIFLVLTLEFINTSLEALVDLVSPEIAEKAKIAKDVSAAAVFSTSLLAVLIGLFLFLPKILNLL